MKASIRIKTVKSITDDGRIIVEHNNSEQMIFHNPKVDVSNLVGNKIALCCLPQEKEGNMIFPFYLPDYTI